MAFPTYHETTNQSFSDVASPVSVAMPTTVNANDLLLILWTFKDLNTFTITVPTGWEQIYEVIWNYTGVRFMNANLLRRKADGTEGGTNVSITITGSSPYQAGATQVLRFSSWSGVLSQVEAANTGTSASPSANPDPPNLAPAGGSKEYLWIAAHHNVDLAVTTNAYPTNYINTSTATGGSGSGDTNARSASSTRNLSAASEDPGTFTLSASNRWMGTTIAVPPAPTDQLWWW